MPVLYDFGYPLCLTDLATNETQLLAPHSAVLRDRFGQLFGEWSPASDWVIIVDHQNVGSSFLPYYTVAHQDGSPHRELTDHVDYSLVGWLPDTVSRETVQNLPTIETHRQPVLAHDSFAYAVTWSADGALIATGSQHGSIRLWSAADGSLVKEIIAATDESRAVRALRFTSYGTRLVALIGSQDSFTVEIWNVDAAALESTFSRGDFPAAEADIVLEPAKLVYFEEDLSPLVLVDLAGQQYTTSKSRAVWANIRQRLEVDAETNVLSLVDDVTGTVQDLPIAPQWWFPEGYFDISSDGRMIAGVLPTQAEVVVWEIETGSEIAAWYTAGFSLQFSPNGRQLAVAGSYNLHIFDLP